MVTIRVRALDHRFAHRNARLKSNARLTHAENFETDYLQEGDPGFKKPKKSKKKNKDRSTRKPTATADDDDSGLPSASADGMDVDTVPVQTAPSASIDDGPGGLDDEEVQAAMRG